MSSTYLRGLCLALILLYSPALHAATPTPLPLPGQDAPSVLLWTAEASYPGEPLADARLEAPVRFWRAGLSMSEVFTGVKEQTGVEVLFWPPDDVNQRMRVTLYLNPKTPPSLRELLVQLAWVENSTFACTATAPRKYYLLGTPIQADLVPQLYYEQAAQQKVAEQERMEQETEARGNAREAFARYKEALALPREELIARYRGQDDRLLYNLLNERTGPLVEALGGLPEPDQKALWETGTVAVPWATLSQDTRTALLKAIPSRPGGSPEEPEQVYVSIYSLGMAVRTMGNRGPMGFGGLQFFQPGKDTPLNPWEQLELRRALGETVPKEEEDRVLKQAREEAMRTVQDKMFKELRAKLDAVALSESAKNRLRASSLPWSESHSYQLWQIQEAVARLTGYHIVSDCSWSQPPMMPRFVLQAIDQEFQAAERERMEKVQAWMTEHRDEVLKARRSGGFQSPPELLKLQQTPPRTEPLLLWLQTWCYYNSADRDKWLDMADYLSGWDWGDEGSFLRFRTPFLCAFRSSLLPEDFVKEAENYFTPDVATLMKEQVTEVQEVATPWRTPPAATRRPPLDQMMWFGLHVSDTQSTLGGKLTYYDPTSPNAPARQAVLAELADTMKNSVTHFTFLSSLSPEQWEKMCSEAGLPYTSLSPSQQRKFVGGLHGNERFRELLKTSLDTAVIFFSGNDYGGGPDQKPGGPVPNGGLSVTIADEPFGLAFIKFEQRFNRPAYRLITELFPGLPALPTEEKGK